MKGRSKSPLFVWKLVLSLVLLTLVIFLSYDPRKLRSSTILRTLIKKLDRVHFGPKENGILIVGNSLLQHGLPLEDQRIAAILKVSLTNEAKGAPDCRIFSVMYPGETAEHLSAITNRLIALRPRKIVIQVDVLIQKQMDDIPAERLQNWCRYLREQFFAFTTSISGLDLEEPGGVLLRPPLEADLVQQTAVKRYLELEYKKTRNLWENQRLPSMDEDTKFAKDFVNETRSNGIRLIVLETPHSNTVAKYAPNGYFERRAAIVNSILKPVAGEYFRYPNVLPDEFFADYRHLNLEGIKLYVQWLFPRLAPSLVRKD